MDQKMTDAAKKSFFTRKRIIIGVVVFVAVFIILMVILKSTGVIKTSEAYASVDATQNNNLESKVNRNQSFVDNSTTATELTQAGAVNEVVNVVVPEVVDPNLELYQYTPQVDVTDTFQKSVFGYFTSDKRLKGPMPEYVALDGTKFVKFQGRSCVNFRPVPITPRELTDMIAKGVVNDIEQQLESCSKKEYCVGLKYFQKKWNLCVTDDLKDKFIPCNCLEKNLDNQCLRCEQGATNMGYNVSGTWMRESEMQRGGLSGDWNTPMKREIKHNHMEYLELRDNYRPLFVCADADELADTASSSFDTVLDLCSGYENPPGGCQVIKKTATGFVGCSKVRFSENPVDPKLSKFVVTPSLVTAGQVTHILNDYLMELSPRAFNIAYKFYFNRNHAEFKKEETTDLPGWKDALLDL